MANENCLAGLRCPKCGSYGPFGIEVTAWAVNVTDDGIDAVENVERDRDSIIRCKTCYEVATVADFDEVLYGKAGGEEIAEHPDFTKADWREEVSSDNTCLGYADWVAHKSEELAHDLYGGQDAAAPEQESSENKG